jgi:hypothetical protein
MAIILNFLVILLSFSNCIGNPISERRNTLERRYSGKATWFIPDTGACGDTNSESDYIVAMNQPQVSDSLIFFFVGSSIILKPGGKAYWWFGKKYNGGAPCHKTVSITNLANGKTVKAKVTDEVRQFIFHCLLDKNMPTRSDHSCFSVLPVAMALWIFHLRLSKH